MQNLKQQSTKNEKTHSRKSPDYIIGDEEFVWKRFKYVMQLYVYLLYLWNKNKCTDIVFTFLRQSIYDKHKNLLEKQLKEVDLKLPWSLKDPMIVYVLEHLVSRLNLMVQEVVERDEKAQNQFRILITEVDLNILALQKYILFGQPLLPNLMWL